MYQLIVVLLKNSVSFYYLPIYFCAIALASEDIITDVLMVFASIGFLSLFDFGYSLDGVYGRSRVGFLRSTIITISVVLSVCMLDFFGILLQIYDLVFFNYLFYIISTLVNIRCSRLKVDFDFTLKSHGWASFIRGLAAFSRWLVVLVCVLREVQVKELFVGIVLVDIGILFILLSLSDEFIGDNNVKEVIKSNNKSQTALMLSLSNLLSSSVTLSMRSFLLSTGQVSDFIVFDVLLRGGAFFAQISNRLLYFMSSVEMILKKQLLTVLTIIYYSFFWCFFRNGFDILIGIHVYFAFATPFIMASFKHSVYVYFKILIYSIYITLVVLWGV